MLLNTESNVSPYVYMASHLQWLSACIPNAEVPSSNPDQAYGKKIISKSGYYKYISIPPDIWIL